MFTHTAPPRPAPPCSKGMQTDCAWTASASYKTANLFFPDAESIYHVMYFSQFGPQDMAMYVRPPPPHTHASRDGVTHETRRSPSKPSNTRPTTTRIEGDFPDARYFSVQSYDDTFSPITSMRDFEIQPSVGANHFAKKATNQLRGGKGARTVHARPFLHMVFMAPSFLRSYFCV